MSFTIIHFHFKHDIQGNKFMPSGNQLTGRPCMERACEKSKLW